MYAIETELGRFEAATERAAKKLLKAAAAAAERAENERCAVYAAAKSAAESRAYHLYNCRGRGDSPGLWLFDSFTDGGDRYGFKVCRAVSVGGSLDRRSLIVHTPTGEAAAELWCQNLTGVLTDGGGWVAAVELQEDNGQPAKLHAVGVAGPPGAEVLALARMDGFPVDWFKSGGDQ